MALAGKKRRLIRIDGVDLERAVSIHRGRTRLLLQPAGGKGLKIEVLAGHAVRRPEGIAGIGLSRVRRSEIDEDFIRDVAARLGRAGLARELAA